MGVVAGGLRDLARVDRAAIGPVAGALRVVPVAGRDSMLLNLSGAHAPFFTRNLLILTDSDGATGVGEVPGGESIRRTLEDAAALVVDTAIGDWQAALGRMLEEGRIRIRVRAERGQRCR